MKTLFLSCLDQTSRELNDWALKKQSQGQDSPMSITFYFRFNPVSRCLSTFFRDRNLVTSRTDPERIRFQDVFQLFIGNQTKISTNKIARKTKIIRGID